MALALYRKYRPRTFAEVIGQEHVTEPLSQALRSGRLHHAYLFSGPRGCGKTSSARILARSLNCEQGPTPEPCGVCISCRSLANDGTGSIDVLEIDAASHGGVDDARELREKAFFAPANSRFKIYVIDEAHMVSSAGFNALLKLVEEPPDYVKFIFATTEPDKVLGTIRSRTHHYPFRLIPPATLRPYLQQLTEAEGVNVEPAVFPLVVRAGGGSARDSLSVLDQLIAGAGPDGVSYARAVALLGVTDVALIDEMCDALAAADGAAAYSTIDRVAEAGHDPRRFASDLLERLRDLIVLQQVPDAVAKGLIDGPTDQLEAMSAQATRLGPATLSRCADIVHNGLIEMRGTTAPRLLLELITARMLLPGAEDSTGSLLQRLERMERRLTLSGDLPPGVRGELPAGPPPASPAPASGDGGGGGLSAARAAAAAARRASGAGASVVTRPAADPTPAAADPTPPAAGPTPPAAGPVSPVDEPGRQRAAAGVEPVSAPAAQAEQSSPGHPSDHLVEPADDDEPPWDDEPESDQYGPPADQPGPAPTAEPGTSLPSGQATPAVPSAVRASAAQTDRPADRATDPLGGSGQSASVDWPTAQATAATAATAAQYAAAAPQAAAWAPAEAAPAPVGTAQTAVPARRTVPAGVLPDAPEEPGEAAVAAAIPGQLDVTAVREVWPEIITAIGRHSKKVAALASGATVRDFDGQTVVLTFRFPAHARMVAPEATVIADALYEALGGRWNVRCDVAGANDSTESATPSPGRVGSAVRGPAVGSVVDRGGPAAGSPADGRGPAGPSVGGRGSVPGSTVDGGGSAAGPSVGGRGPAADSVVGDDGSAVDSPGTGRESAGGAASDGRRAARYEGARHDQSQHQPPRGTGSRPAQSEAGAAQAQANRAAARAPQNRRPEAETPGHAGGDDDWPEPARPGGAAAPVSRAPIDVADDDEDWPEVRAVGSGNPAVGVGSTEQGAGTAGTTGSDIAAADTGDGREKGDPSGEHFGTVPAAGGDRTVVADHGRAGAVTDLAGGATPGGWGVTPGGDGATGGRGVTPPGGSGATSGRSGAIPGGSGAGSDGDGSAGGESKLGTSSSEKAESRIGVTTGAAGTGRPGATSLGDAPAALGPSGAADVSDSGAARTGSGSRNAGPSSGLAAARAAAAGGRSPLSRPAAKPGAPGWSDGSPAEEAPYDPEYDGPPARVPVGGGGSASFEGFDPGDEPLDEVIDEKTARESSEQQAMRLLRDAFGAEKIGES